MWSFAIINNRLTEIFFEKKEEQAFNKRTLLCKKVRIQN